MEKFRPIWIVIAAALLAGILIWAKPWEKQTLPLNSDAVAVSQSNLSGTDDRAITLAGFTAIEDGESVLRLSGYAEPNIPIEISDSEGRSVSFRSDDEGAWDTTLSRDGDQNLQIALRTVIGPDTKIVTDQNAIRIVGPVATLNSELDDAGLGTPLTVQQTALLAVTQPGNASRIIRAPFAAPRSGPISLVSIDYDNGGWAIISGRSTESGFVRAVVGGVDIGSTGTAEDGSWSILSDRGLPPGELSLTLEFLNEDSVSSQLRVIFDRRFYSAPADGLDVQQTPTMWTVTRNLAAGGVQHLCVFSELAKQIIISEQ